MKLTDLQKQILGKMRLTPLPGIEIKNRVGYQGSDRSFSNALLRMCDKGPIEMTEIGSYATTAAGLIAFLTEPPRP